ncbi:MAG: metal-binding protein [Leptolyngbyaceae cyanobacterium]
MPSGKTHDRITIGATPWLGLITQLVTQHWGYTVLVIGGFVFAGLMFGPDLDIHSVQSKRWGWLAWIWRPYRRSLRHRSWLSHGFLAGTLVRLLYLSGWILVGILLVLEVSNTAGHTSVTWRELGQSIGQILVRHWRIWAAIALGIEIGAMSHSLADWSTSAWKRERKRTPKNRRSPRR